jgi:hypothetical protein
MASYFSYFPKVLYDLAGDIQSPSAQLVTNITKRVSFIKELQGQANLYYAYTIKDIDTPENIADRYYGDPQYFWLVLLFNNIFDGELDWPKNETVLYQYMVNQYGLPNLNAVHHYTKTVVSVDSHSGATTTFQYTIDQTTFDQQGSEFQVITAADGSSISLNTTVQAVSNYDYETDLNEKKRQINILKKDYVGQVISNFQTLMST